MTDAAAPSPALRASRWRTHLDRALVVAIIIALWSLATWLMNAMEARLLRWRPPIEPMMETGT